MLRNPKIQLALAALAGMLAGILLTAAGGIYYVWGDEVRSLMSIQQLAENDPDHKDGYVYQMQIYGDYDFEEFLAQGGASSDAELIDFVTQSITKGLIPMSIESKEIACSSFTAQAADGDRLFARNYDFDQTNTCIVYTNPGDGRHASVSTIDLQFLGIDTETGLTGLSDQLLCLAAPFVPLDGVNDAGLSCGIYMSYQGGEKTVPTDQQTDKPDLTSTTLLRLFLDYASTVDEAIELAQQYDLHDSAGTSYHYMVADAQGNSAVLEWVSGTDATDNDGSARRLRVIRNTDAENTRLTGTETFQCVTNYILAPNYYAEGESRGGADRYDHLMDALQQTEGQLADSQAAMDLLAEVGRRNWIVDGDHTQGTTVHSVVYNLTDCTALWVGNEHYGEEDYTFELELPA